MAGLFAVLVFNTQLHKYSIGPLHVFKMNANGVLLMQVMPTWTNDEDNIYGTEPYNQNKTKLQQLQINMLLQDLHLCEWHMSYLIDHKIWKLKNSQIKLQVSVWERIPCKLFQIRMRWTCPRS